jgi:hypothetical protein
MIGAARVKVDHHAAVLALRQRYGKCHQTLRVAREPQREIDALESCQRLLEGVAPDVLKVEAVQQIIAHVLDGLGGTRLDGLYHHAVMIYFYSLGVEAKGTLSDRLFEKF